MELKLIPFDCAKEFEMPIFYLDERIGTRRVDSFIENKLSVELKAVSKLDDTNLAQLFTILSNPKNQMNPLNPSSGNEKN